MTRIPAVVRWMFMLVCLLSLGGMVSSAFGEAMDLAKAMKVGTGPKIVIEFTDPDCPYCRKGAEYFKGRTDVTRYIFFNPLSMHPQAADKARVILSSSDRTAAYEEAMTGKMDNRRLSGITGEGSRLLEAQIAIARQERIESTPTYIICGRIIKGFDQKRIAEALGD